ncbi:MAG TPA: hypothetical protein PKI19_06055 [Elusimicrobiales bacterium]|nr:hypothetical protein [Elusimicrobiales bacterium]
MKITRAFVLAAFAAAAFSTAAMAGDNVLLALNAPVKKTIKSELAVSATAQLKTPDAGYTDFDALSTVNDPLYLEASKEMLKQAPKIDAAAAGKAVPVMRDAPNSKPASRIKKPRVKKSLPADPVKIKDTL